MSRLNRCFLLVVVLAWTGAATAPGQVLNYAGRIAVDGRPFNGNGFFVFSIHDTSGEILWASGDFPQVGTSHHPVATWQLAVRDGLYQTRLGDTAIGMPLLDTARVLAAKNPFLRVWFHDGTGRGWQAAGDTPIKPALAGKAAGAGAEAINGNQAEAILRELREMRALVQKPSGAAKPAVPEPPRTVTVPLGESPSLGEPAAPVVLVEFTDFQCPFCKRANDEMLSAVRKKYVETGKVRLVSRCLPLAFHPNSEPAANAALCAGEQKQFWEMRERLFANPEALSQADFVQAAGELKLDAKAFATCLEAKRFAAVIGRDKQDAATAGITGTPTFVLGRATGGHVTGLLLVGAKPMAFVEAEIEKLLSAK